ncbi:hypothetical protein IVB16_27365 [Bradyrhizobium sp. 183]|uniref:hypothetical protein n=1 Tax=unclassified Bradyrhizobium TaxID=2631580 RepID=UPI001FFFEA4D|nr:MULTISPECIES: hypothetical protein [unclassified Bradyrhizobium]UPJ78570.1 hypothetical protein IVB17_27365 [Bradyrhizobium sp. 184]UPJ86365.1 hypothetical protein IVB16_27365 [Bradyrhizobium sp. 183]
MLSPTINTARIRVPARLLLKGDVTGSNETVLGVSAGVATPRGKVEVFLDKAGRKRMAVWNAHTMIGVRREGAGDNPPAGGISSDEIPPSDRLPTFHELASFDAGAAWDRLSVEQQREVGVLALRFGTVGQCEGYFHETAEGVRKGFSSSHWTPQVQATAVWPRLHIELVESAARAAFEALCEHFDPLWPQLFGWATRKEVKQP